MGLCLASTVFGRNRPGDSHLIRFQPPYKVSPVAASGTISSPPSAPRTSLHRLFAVSPILRISHDLSDSSELFHRSGSCREPPGQLAPAGLLHLPLSGERLGAAFPCPSHPSSCACAGLLCSIPGQSLRSGLTPSLRACLLCLTWNSLGRPGCPRDHNTYCLCLLNVAVEV